MDSFLTMERFLKMRGNLITPPFSVLSLDHDFEFNENKIGPLNLLSGEIEYVRRHLRKIGDQEKISKLFEASYYLNCLHSIDLEKNTTSKIVTSSEIYGDFLHTYAYHQNLLQINEIAYAKMIDRDRDLLMEHLKILAFKDSLEKNGFDPKTLNYSAIFLILFWENLEKLAAKIRDSARMNLHKKIYKFIRNKTEITENIFLDLEALRLFKDCINSHWSFQYFNQIFIENDSISMRYIETFGQKMAVKNTQAKGGKSKGEAGQKLVEITKFFWEKCREKKPNLLIKTFSEALYSVCKSPRTQSPNSIEEIKNIIKNLKEAEKISILKKSEAQPKAIAARLSGIIRNSSTSE